MAKKRMFSLNVIDTDTFMDLPLSTQALYFHLGMRGDDDGFVSSPRRIIKNIDAEPEDLQRLIDCGLVIKFDSGIIVITDWLINNDLKNDRYKTTTFTAEADQLEILPNKRYSLSCIQVVSNTDTNCIQNGDSTEHNITEHNIAEHITRTREDIFSEFAGEDTELLEALRDYEEMRNKTRHRMTDKARKMALSKLQNFPRDQWIPILNQSVFNSWQGLFPLKKEKPEYKEPDMSWRNDVYTGEEYGEEFYNPG